MCRARLSWRSPERLSRCRTVLPLLAGMGATPARAAKAASLRSRPAWDQDTRNWAAVMAPTPGSSSRPGQAAVTSSSSSVSCSAASASSISARRATARIARTVARCSMLWLGRVRSRAQRSSCWSVVPRRSCSRRASGALTISALSCPMARVRATTAPWRAASSTRMASRSPRARGAAKCSRARASRAARTASSSSDLAPLRRAGRSISTTHSPRSSRNVVNPAPKLPVPSIAQTRRPWPCLSTKASSRL